MKNNDFTPYKEALELKELGFTEDCLGYYNIDPYFPKPLFNLQKPFDHEWCLPTPLYQQAFKFFREKYQINTEIRRTWRYSSNYNPTETFIRFSIYNFKLDRESKEYILYISTKAHNTYEEAELACLKKIIKIVKKK
jgi:hypothetical protein